MKSIYYMTAMLMLFAFNSAHAQDYYLEKWRAVEQLELEDKIVEAEKIVDQIYKRAKRKKHKDQQVKVFLFKSKYKLVNKENAQQDIIHMLDELIENSKFPLANIYHGIQAKLLNDYAMNNQWRIRNRTAGVTTNDDFETWDATRFYSEINKHYQQSIAQSDKLAKIPVSDYKAILGAKPLGRILRPSLLDLLSHEALAFYKSGYFNLTEPKEQFYITKENAFLDTDKLLVLKRPVGDTVFSKYDVIQLYASLEKMHKKLNHNQAYLHILIDRLNYTKNQLNSSEPIAEYEKTLTDIIDKNSKNPVVTEAYYYLANYYNQLSNQGEDKEIQKQHRKKAIELLNKGIQLFPDSYGGVLCEQVHDQIHQPQLNIHVENLIIPDSPHRGVITYSNTPSVSLYYVKAPFNTSFNVNYKDRDSLARKFLEDAIKDKTIQYSQKIELPQADDTFTHSYEYVVPALEKGHYVVFARYDLEEQPYLLSHTFITLTNLTLFKNTAGSGVAITVKNRQSGQLENDVKVQIYRDNKTRHKGFTNSSGSIKFNQLFDRGFYGSVMATKNGDTIKTRFNHYSYGDNDDQPTRQSQTFIYLDRAIYRPGQTVYFKTIAITDFKGDSQVLENLDLQLIVKDANYQEIKKIDLTTNDYGSTHGSFELPLDVLTGTFNIEVERANNKGSKRIGNWRNQHHSFQVEEYKRPTFEVDFKEVTATYQLEDSVTLTGFAKAFLGSNITDADVNYKVYRSFNYSKWCSFYYDRSDKVIAQGESVTNNTGEFPITFLAATDPTADSNYKPIYNYRIEAEVTDLNGETRTATTYVRIGANALQVDLQLPQELSVENNELQLAAKNLNNQYVDARLILEVRKAIEPNHVIITSGLQTAQFHQLDDVTYRKTFPYAELREDELEKDWKKSPIVFSKEIRTDSLTSIALPITKNWNNGNYYFYVRAVEPDHSFDNEDNVVERREDKDLWIDKDKPLKSNLLSVNTDRKDDKAIFNLYTAMDGVYATLMVWDEKGMIEGREIFLRKGKTTLVYDFKNSTGNTLQMNVQVQKENAFIQQNATVSKPVQKASSYTINTATFRNKLEPGVDEAWSFTIKDDSGIAMKAEVLASMYDKSLDEFAASYWNAPYIYSYKNTYSPDIGQLITGKNNQYVSLHFPRSGYGYRYHQLNYDQFNFHGLSFYNFNNQYRYYKNRLARKYVELQAREGYVVGSVYDADGGLYGATIQVKGTSIATTSDFDGNYSINATAQDVLVFNYTGYEAQEIPVRNQTIIHVTMDEALNSVVVTGYRSVEREKSKISNDRGDMSGMIATEQMDMEADGISANYELAPVLKSEVSSSVVVTVTDTIAVVDDKQLDKIVARKNLQETAFFLPDLRTDEQGNLKFSFTSPEALTQWKFRMLAHNKKAETAQLEQLVVTQKELSIVPNAPRFLRETDTIRFSAKIANLSDAAMNGTARLQLFDAVTMQSIDTPLGNVQNTKNFTIDTGGNTSVNWIFKIPIGTQAVTYRIVAQAGSFSDGEENTLPVLTNRMLVNESRALWVRAGETQTATMDRLATSDSGTMAHHQMVFEYTSNPSWYAIKSLPYLMEYEHDCAEQTFSKYYANAMAHHILTSNPKVKEVFDSWAQNGTNVSPLEKNEELKTVLLAHTPWLRDAQSEAEKQQRLATLFDLARTARAQQKSLARLEKLQGHTGGFPWFSGGRTNEYITRHIAAGIGHLNKLGVNDKHRPQTDRIYTNAMRALDKEWVKRFKNHLKHHKTIEDFGYGNAYWHYLYAGSFDVDNTSNDDLLRDGVDSAFAKAEKEYAMQPLYTKLLIAVVAHRHGKTQLATDILEGLRQTAVHSDENGMYWKDNTNSWYWYSSDIETQALAIEVFQEVTQDDTSVEELKIWLLKNKRTNQWKSTKATADATYALLLQGGKWLDVQENNKITWGNKPLPQEMMKTVEKEAGTGYFKLTMPAAQVHQELATVTVKNKSDVTGYGALYWQYFEDLDKIEVDDDLPLSVKKKLYKKVMTDSGERLEEITSESPLTIGDLITVRIEIRTTADLDFVHLKDMRASGLEPIDVISRYQWQDGLGYYQSTKDVATHFFFDRMSKGTYVFEYDVRANNAGQFSNGITQLECMYAPEFSSHSEGIRISIEE